MVTGTLPARSPKALTFMRHSLPDDMSWCDGICQRSDQALVRIALTVLLQASSESPTPRSKFKKQHTLLVGVRIPSNDASGGRSHIAKRAYMARRGQTTLKI